MSVLTGPGDAVRPVDMDVLVARVEALRRLLNAVSGRVPVDHLTTARAAIDRAGERLRLSADHTVVALAGATGSGKSSLFNALTGLELSRVGVRRPTTSTAHACVWNPSGAAELLDWLGIPKKHQIARESVLDGEHEADLRGLVLLDLPDFDSVEVAHHLEVDRLTGLADLLVWVLDPQKYADAVLHRRYLAGLARYTAVTVVVLNQIDRLSPEQTDRCLTDVRRLLDEDGLHGVRLLATSAKTRAGIPDLRDLLIDTVSARLARLERLAGDVDAAVDSVAHLVGPPVAEDAVDRAMVNALAVRLGDSAGVAAVAAVAAETYRRRGRAMLWWPVSGRSAPVRPDLVDDEPELFEESPDGPTRHAAPESSPARRSQVELAVRGLAEQVARELPPPWPEAVTAVSRRHADLLPDELDEVVRETDLGLDQTPVWWRVVGVLRWVLCAAAAVGAVWLLVRTVTAGSGDVRPYVVAGVDVPTMLLGAGIILWVATSLLARWLVRRSADRFAERAESMLRNAVAAVARQRVVAPIRSELRAYAEACDALDAARGAR